jgi:hypothetical protein
MEMGLVLMLFFSMGYMVRDKVGPLHKTLMNMLFKK